MRNPFFSVITISLNQADFLRKCLDSVFNQKFQDYEHIVVDPGSIDGSRQIISGFSSDHLVKVFKPDSSPAEGLNNGIELARGDYILFINSDDYFLVDAFDIIYDRLEKANFPDIIFFGGLLNYLDSRIVRRIYPGSVFGILHAFGLSQFFQQGSVIKRSVLKSVGGFNPQNRTCWDGELFLRILSLHYFKATRCKVPVAVFTIHSGSITSSTHQKPEYLKDRKRLVGQYYGSYVLWLSDIIARFPRVIRLLIKYTLDPKLSCWILAGKIRV